MRNAGQALLLDSFGVLKTPIFSSGKLGRCRLVYGLDVRGGFMLAVQKRRQTDVVVRVAESMPGSSGPLLHSLHAH